MQVRWGMSVCVFICVDIYVYVYVFIYVVCCLCGPSCVLNKVIIIIICYAHVRVCGPDLRTAGCAARSR